MGLKLRIQEGSLLDIAFDDVYYLYSPGDIVISNHDTDGAMQLQQVYSVTGGRQRLTGSSKHPRGYRTKINEGGLGSWTDVVIDCYVTYWNGDQLGPIRKTHRVPYFTGKKIITEMRLYPIQFQGEGADNLKARLVERGQRVVECFGHKNYDSMTVESVWDHGSPPISSASSDISTDEDTGPPRSRQALTTDVYIDIQAWNRERPLKFNSLLRSPGDVNEVEEERYGPGRRNDYRSFDDSGIDIQQSDRFLASPRSITRAGKLTELEDPAKTFLMLLPTTVPGFDLRRRRWVWLNIDNIEDIDKSDQARARGWEDLVINKEHRELLSSLVQTHTTSTTMEFKRQQTKLRSKAFAQMDLVKEKGRGLIILLHGPPGETIAAYTGKPLYAITCGDIGASPTAVEKNLAEHTERAARWDCVLLLDEADVFLARRGWTDVYRNALVSIFLRHIEYYTGILFLTTNIVGIIDEAFKSRIHIALRYDPIDLKATKVIWENMLNRIEKDNEDAEVKIKFNRDALMRFAREHYKQHEQDDTTWNARQIRNAFTTAIAMGQYDYIKRAEEANLEQYDSRKKGTHSSIKRHDKIRLTTKNFEKIADTATDFEQYIGTVRGRDADNALDNEYRNDNFGRNRAPPRKDYRRQTEDEWITSILSSRTGRDRYSQQPPSQPSKGKKILKRTDDRYRRREDDEAEEDVNDEDEDEDEGDDDEIEDSSSEEDASE
ncbi:hypothetical protein F5Y16DRAFT_418171 [Xylariaceae sp. FL0255]|nr:hypothetical protein F5Y16DRAFT_418171 [Xylariaceae sp. FL0255]